MNPEKVVEFFLHREHIRGLTGLGGGVLSLFLINILLKPDLKQVPNWESFDYVIELVFFFVVAYFIGQLLLLVGWTWERMMRLEIPSYKKLHSSSQEVYAKWCKYFRNRPDSLHVTPAEVRSTISSQEIEKFLDDSGSAGIKGRRGTLKQSLYIARVLVAISLFLTIDCILGFSGQIPFTLINFSLSSVILVLLTFECIFSHNSLKEFDAEVGKFLIKIQSAPTPQVKRP